MASLSSSSLSAGRSSRIGLCLTSRDCKISTNKREVFSDGDQLQSLRPDSRGDETWSPGTQTRLICAITTAARGPHSSVSSSTWWNWCQIISFSI